MKTNKTFANALLIAANMVPLVGAIFYGWDGKGIIVLYILETVMIGILNVFKMFIAYFSGANRFADKSDTGNVKGLAIIPFFIFHYNFFIFVQSVLFFAFSSIWSKGRGPEPFNIIGNFSLYINEETAIALGSLLISNLYFLINDFIVSGKYKIEPLDKLMFQPYKRIFLQQFLVIIGGFIFMLSGQVIAVLVLFVLLKTTGDFFSANYLNNPKVRQWLAKNMKGKDGKPLTEEEENQLKNIFGN